MNAPIERRSAVQWRVDANGFLRLTLRCARNAYGGIDRRMPEAWALANWLGENASALGLGDAAFLEDPAANGARRRSVAIKEWRRIGAALETAGRPDVDRQDAPIDRWLRALAAALALDALEVEILTLALLYQLDQRIERLFDAL